MYRNFIPFIRNLAKLNSNLTAPIRFRCSQAEFPFKTEFLEIAESAKNGPTRKLAYTKINENSVNQPGVLYVPGFMAHGTAVKAQEFLNLCQENDVPCITYDPSGLGRSKDYSMPLVNCRYEHWLADAEQILAKVANGPYILVGSSMGCWLSCILAQRYPDKVKALLLIAPGVNFGEQYRDKILSMLPQELIKKLEQGEILEYYNPDYGTFPLSLGLLESMIRQNLPTDPDSLPITCPIRIVYSIQDKDVPQKDVLRLFKSFSGKDVHLTYLKTGHHQLHEPENLSLLRDTLTKLRNHEIFSS